MLLDCNVEAGEGYFGFGGAEHSPDHTLLAWAADRQGSEYYTIHVRDLATGKDTGEVIVEAADGGAWSPDGRAIYYTEFDESHRPFRVRRHQLGTPQSADEIVFEEADPGFFVGVGETLSRQFIVIDVHDHQTSEVWLIDRDGRRAAPGRAAADGARVRRRGARRRALHPHQRGRRRGLQDRHRAGRRLRAPRTGSIWCRTRRAC